MESYANFEGSVKEAFGNRLKYIGLRGSHLRGEAQERSDVDFLIILDGVAQRDLEVLKSLIRKQPHRISPYVLSSDEFRGLPRHVKAQFWLEEPQIFSMFGVPEPTRDDLWEIVRSDLDVAIHTVRHYYLEEHPEDQILKGLRYYVKTCDFALRVIVYILTGDYPTTRSQLKAKLEALGLAEHKEILNILDDWDKLSDEWKKDISSFLSNLDYFLRKMAEMASNIYQQQQ